MTRSSQFRPSAGGAAKLSTLFVALFVLSSCAPKRTAEPVSERLRYLGCRIVSVSNGSPRTILPLADVDLDMMSGDPVDKTFEAAIHDGRRLAARVRQVNVALPRDRFNVAMTLDGKTLLRANHMDLDIYIETTIDEHVYALHCFPEVVVIEGVPAEP